MTRVNFLVLGLTAFTLTACDTENSPSAPLDDQNVTQSIDASECQIACEKLVTCWEVLWMFVGGDSDYGYYGGYYNSFNSCRDDYYYGSGYYGSGYYGSGPTPSSALCDAGWTCDSWDFGDGECDCGCGIPDPDCSSGGCTTGDCFELSCESCHSEGGWDSACPPSTTWENGDEVVLACANGDSCGRAIRHADTVDECVAGCTADVQANATQIACLNINACPDMLWACVGVDNGYGY